MLTCGYGPVPKAVMDHFDAVDSAVDLLNATPLVGGSGGRPGGTGIHAYPWTWAARGFYLHDWRDGSGPYLRAEVPSVPLTVDDLADARVRQAAMLARFTVDFASASRLDLSDLAAGS